MEKIKVIFTREKDPDFISKKIMEKDGTNYSHVLIDYDENGERKIFHAVGEGVCIYAENKYKDYYKSHIKAHEYEIELKVSKDFFLGYVEGSCGKEYSQSQIAAIAVGGILENGDEAMICSELAGLVIRDLCGIELKGKQDGWRPIHCFRALENSCLYKRNSEFYCKKL